MFIHDSQGRRADADFCIIARAPEGNYCTMAPSIFSYRRRAPLLLILCDSFATETRPLALLTRLIRHGFKRLAKALGVAHP